MTEGMATLTDHITYADAQRLCSPARLWELFDGDRQRMNIAHECIDRHPADRVAVRLVHSQEHGGHDEAFTFGLLQGGVDAHEAATITGLNGVRNHGHGRGEPAGHGGRASGGRRNRARSRSR